MRQVWGTYQEAPHSSASSEYVWHCDCHSGSDSPALNPFWYLLWPLVLGSAPAFRILDCSLVSSAPSSVERRNVPGQLLARNPYELQRWMCIHMHAFSPSGLAKLVAYSMARVWPMSLRLRKLELPTVTSNLLILFTAPPYSVVPAQG